MLVVSRQKVRNMKITSIRIKLATSRNNDRLVGFASVVFDQCLCLKDIRIVEGNEGILVAMPSRKVTDCCPMCHTRNHLRSRYCSYCGFKLVDARAKCWNCKGEGSCLYPSTREKICCEFCNGSGWRRLWIDVAHPITEEFRHYIEGTIIEEYQKELDRNSNNTLDRYEESVD